MCDSTPLKRCSKCKLDKPATREYFTPSKTSKDRLDPRCKECEKLRRNAKRDANRAAHNAYNRASYHARKKDPEARKRKSDSGKRSYAKNKAKVKAYRIAHSEERKAYMQAYKPLYLKTERGRAVHLAAGQRRRARERQAQGNYTADDVQLLFVSQKGLCWWCGQKLPKNYHVDHRIPISRGGSNNSDNLCLSCPKCNLSRHNKMPWEWSDRLL